MRKLVTLILCAGAVVRADTFAVLPFFNVSKNASLSWIGESLADSIREALASEGVVAIERPDREEVYRRLAIRHGAVLTRASVLKIGEALDVDRVIYGQFDVLPAAEGSKSRGSLKITAHLVDVRRLRQGPEYGEVGSLEDLAALEAHLAWQTLEFIVPRTAPSEGEFRRRHPAVRVDAIESYVRGLLLRNPEDKHRMFTQAARLDPAYSPPRFQLGRLHFDRKEYKAAAEWLQKVSADDSHFREANFLLGLSRYFTGDYPGAETAFQIVAKSVPLNEVYNNIGAAQSRRNLASALENFQRALDGDPSDPSYHFNTGYQLWKLGRYGPAADRFRAVLDRNPQDPDATLLLGRCLSQNGPRPGETRIEGLERLKTNYEESAYRQLKAVLQPEKP